MTHQRTSCAFWAEAVAAAAVGILALLTLLWPDWIEALTGIDPDHSSGLLEWTLAAGLAAASFGLSLLARREGRRAAPAVA